MSQILLHKVRRPRIYEELVEQVVENIVSGRTPPGTVLPSERELMEQFGVGRSSVREALFALQKMGLVALNNGERASVVAPTSEALVGELGGAVRYYLSQYSGVRHFQNARLFFEVGLARHSALHATTDDIELLRRALEANREARHDIEQFIDTDVAFHFVLAEIARNPIFTTLHQAMAAWLREQRATGVKAPGSLEAAISAHARIFDAVASKDADGAEHEMRQHMVQVADYYWSAQKVVPE